MKNKAFTLAEILIVLVIIGVLAVIMMRNLRADNIKEKTYTAKAYKAILAFDQAAMQIRDINKTNCPMGKFIFSSGLKSGSTSEYDYEIGLVNADKTVVNSQQALDIFGEEIKFTQTNLDFCNYSKYCENTNAGIAEEEDKIKAGDIPAAKMAGDVYVGIRVHDIEDCPSFHFPQIENALSPKTKLDGGTPQCWATLYIDANGKDEPNVEGRDIYKFGLDALGVYH